MAKVSNFADLPLERQLARCAFVALALGHAFLNFPEDFQGGKKDQDALERTTKWLNKVSDGIGKNKLPKAGSLAVQKLIDRFTKMDVSHGLASKPKSFRQTAIIWCAIVFLWDVRVTCPAVAKGSAWRFLDLASEQIGRALLAAHDGADLFADKIYEELVW